MNKFEDLLANSVARKASGIDDRFRLSLFRLEPATGKYVAYLYYPSRMVTIPIAIDRREIIRNSGEVLRRLLQVRISAANEELLAFIGELDEPEVPSPPK